MGGVILMALLMHVMRGSYREDVFYSLTYGYVFPFFFLKITKIKYVVHFRQFEIWKWLNGFPVTTVSSLNYWSKKYGKSHEI